MSAMLPAPDLAPVQGYPPADKGRVVVWGLLGGYPFGGMSWQVMHYVAGLRRLGLDVWYVEDAGEITSMDTMDWAYDPLPNVRYLAEQMARLGLEDRWVYRPYGNRGDWFGNGGEEMVTRLYREADAIFNICGFRWVGPDEDIRAPLVYVDTDPGARQIGVACQNQGVIDELDRYTVLSTYAENLGRPGCALPLARYEWAATRPPVVMDWWRAAPNPGRPPLTTITHWNGDPNQFLEWEGRRYEWRKNKLFRRMLDLPQRAHWPLELALRGFNDEARRELEAHGWRISLAGELDAPSAYRAYVRASAGEFTIAKEQYTELGTGWFSDRSVCYLAAGRPVVTEETGFSENIPCGEGLFAFTDADQALAAIEAIASDYDRQARAAEEVAREHFGADCVLSELCGHVGLL